MLGGIDPIIIIQLSSLKSALGDLVKKLPMISDIPTLQDQPPIPIYLSSRITGLQLESEEKSVDLNTDVETQMDATQDPLVAQKGVSSTVTVHLVALKDSIGLMVLSALIDTIFPKATSAEYAITYFSGSVNILRARLESFSFSQDSDTDKLSVTLVLASGKKDVKKTEPPINVKAVEGAIPLQSAT